MGVRIPRSMRKGCGYSTRRVPELEDDHTSRNNISKRDSIFDHAENKQFVWPLPSQLTDFAKAKFLLIFKFFLSLIYLQFQLLNCLFFLVDRFTFREI